MTLKRIYLNRQELKRLYNEEHLGIDAMAKKLGTSHGTVWRALESFGVRRRSLSDANTRHTRVDFSADKNEKAYLIGLRLGDLWVSKNKPGKGSKTILSVATQPSQNKSTLSNLFFLLMDTLILNAIREARSEFCAM